MVATDSYRLALRDLTASAEGEAQALVPERALSEAGRAAAGDEKGGVDLVVDQSQVTFRTGAFTLTSRLIEGQFPNYRQLLPEGYENRLTVSRQQLLDAVKRVGILARENTPVRMEFNALGVRLSSSSPDLGDAVEAVEARYEGADVTVAFNPTYLADGLQASEYHIRSPYNTRLHPGLPPSPIDSPSLQSLRAALQPAHVPYRYFVACGGAGRSRFSTSYAQFLRDSAACVG